MNEYNVDQPIYALATAWAPSALAVVRTSGTGSVELLSRIFSSPGRLMNAASKTLVHGYLRAEDGSNIDEVVLAVYRQGSGYTGEEAVEISCHGSMTTLKRVFVRLEEAGFRLANKGEFTFRAFMHGRMDLTQAEAVEEIISSRSVKSQEQALDRLSGKLSARLNEIRNRLVGILASLEVQLDYAEDEILEEWVYPVSEVDSIISSLQLLSSTYAAGKIWRDGAKVVLAGAANAGKSSLFNFLVREDRSIVSPIEGTTRDYIETDIDLKGIPVRLFDTAGLRESGDVIEAEGIRRTQALIDEADLIILLADSADPVIPSSLADDKRLILVHSKSDLAPAEGHGISVSSVTGEGIEDLVDEIARRLGALSGEKDQSLVIDSERQHDYLEACISCLEASREASGQSVDIIALFFQAALENLGYITGEVTNEELLDRLFSDFCLGK